MTLPPYVKSLAYPTGRLAGFNINHVANKGNPPYRLSVVAGNNAAFLNLTNPSAVATVSGTTQAVKPLIGKCVFAAGNSGTAASNTFSVPNPLPTPTTMTTAAIFQYTQSSGSNFAPYVNSTAAGGAAGNGLIQVSGFIRAIIGGAQVDIVSGGVSMTLNHYYFVACSVNATSPTNMVAIIRDLNTGLTRSAPYNTAVTFGALTATWCAAGATSTFGGSGSNVAAVMLAFNGSLLSPGDIVAWANDPWSYWYPTNNLNVILSSLSLAQKPNSQYDWPLPGMPANELRREPNRSYDLAPTPARLLLGTKPFKQDDWPVPYPVFDERRGQWNRSADLGSTQRLATIKAPITGPTQDLPIPPFRPQVSADIGSTQLLATIKAPITGPTQDLPIPPFRPQVSSDQAPQLWQLNAIQAPITGPTQDLPIQPFRPQFSADQPMSIQRQILTKPPNRLDDWPTPTPPFRPQFSADAGSTQRLATIMAPNPRFDWQLPQQLFRPQFSFDQGNAIYLTITVTLPRNQYDWPLPIAPFRPQVSADQSMFIWQQLLHSPFNQYDWPIAPILPPFVAFEFNVNLVAGTGGDKPYDQYDWPLPIAPFRPQFSFDQGDASFLTIAAPLPRNQYDWPLPIPRFRIDQTTTFNYNPTQMLTGKKPFSQNEWPLPILNPYGNVTIYTITAPNNPNIYPPTPTTVKIEWLIRARRRGRR